MVIPEVISIHPQFDRCKRKGICREPIVWHVTTIPFSCLSCLDTLLKHVLKLYKAQVGIRFFHMSYPPKRSILCRTQEAIVGHDSNAHWFIKGFGESQITQLSLPRGLVNKLVYMTYIHSTWRLLALITTIKVYQVL